MNRIVVGVDGSEGSRRALDWAIAQAKRTGARLTIVTAWHVPVLAYGAPGFAPPVTPSLSESTKKEAERVAAEAAHRAEEAGVETDQVVQQGQAADVLTAAAQDSALLVVGSRGHGGFTGLLLGSVGQQCSHHAPCPLVIVRRLETAA